MRAATAVLAAATFAGLSLSLASELRAQTGATRLIAEARRQLDELNSDSAVALLRRALVPESAAATGERVRGLVLLGVAEMSVGRTDSARAAFRRALSLDRALRVDTLSELHSDLLRTFEAVRESVVRLAGVLEFRGLPPAARVLVDGTLWAEERGTVEPGIRRFEVSAAGYTPVRDSVRIAPGATVIRDVTLVRVAMARQETPVTVVVSSASTTSEGGPQPFSAVAKDSLGRVLSGTVFTWASLNPNVATIDSVTGVATAVASGQATVSATVDGVTGYGLLTVAVPRAAPVSSWSAMDSQSRMGLTAVWGTSGVDVYAVGNGGTILQHNGSRWSPMTTGTTQPLYAVWGASRSHVYAVGDGGTILRYNGTSWSAMNSGTGRTFLGVWGTSGSELFAVGTSGTILRYNGTSWNAMRSGTAEHLFAVWGTSGTDVYAVGNNGTILRYDGVTWSAMTGGTTQAIVAVWGVSGSELYAVGSGGTILRYDGSSWSAMTSGSTQSLYGVWGTSASDLYAVGSSGTILRYDGASWNSMRSWTSAGLRGIWGTSGAAVFVVGPAGPILRGAR